MKPEETTKILNKTLAELETLGNEKMRVQNIRHGATTKQFGVRLGELRKVAKKIKINRELALALWETKIIEARLLAILIILPESLSSEEVDSMVKSVNFTQVADWINTYIIKKHPEKETLRQDWMVSENPMAARAGWNLTAERISKSPEGIDIPKILNRLESEMGNADSLVQWTMNFALGATGINFPEYRERAIAIGHKLGIYKDYPVSKGCTSPFVPIWIETMVQRQK